LGGYVAVDAAMAASQTVAFLAPFLPYLFKLGEAAAEEAGSRLGAVAWERAKVLWANLVPAVEPDERALVAAERLATAPERRELRSRLRAELGRLLEGDPRLAADVERLLSNHQPSDSGTVIQHGPVTDSITIGNVGSITGNVGNITHYRGTWSRRRRPGPRFTDEPG
jgi:hypothetical protein